MLAATPDTTSRLGLLSLVLESISGSASDTVPETLKIHALSVLKSAAEIDRDPQTINRETPTEAIELALAMAGHTAVLGKMSALQALDGLHPEDAKEILNSIQPLAA